MFLSILNVLNFEVFKFHLHCSARQKAYMICLLEERQSCVCREESDRNSIRLPHPLHRCTKSCDSRIPFQMKYYLMPKCAKACILAISQELHTGAGIFSQCMVEHFSFVFCYDRNQPVLFNFFQTYKILF